MFEFANLHLQRAFAIYFRPWQLKIYKTAFMKRSVISGTGSYIPTVLKENADFMEQDFYAEDGVLINTKKVTLIEKFKKITGIEERRYVPAELNTSDIAAMAAAKAIEDSRC